MKLFVFKNHLRPCVHIPSNFDIHIVKDTILKKTCSFPSGHAAVIFAIVIFLVLFLNPKWYYATLMLILASLVSYSRVYLGQHFYTDIYVGAVIGGLSTLLTYILLVSNNKLPWLLDNNLLDQIKYCLLKLLKK